jgi:hypothetical protein
MFGRKSPASGADEAQAVEQPVQEQKQPFWKAILPVMACGAGLFSDGYINNVRLSVELSHARCANCARERY